MVVRALATELFDLGANHERAPELRARLLALLTLARSRAEARWKNPPSSRE